MKETNKNIIAGADIDSGQVGATLLKSEVIKSKFCLYHLLCIVSLLYLQLYIIYLLHFLLGDALEVNVFSSGMNSAQYNTSVAVPSNCSVEILLYLKWLNYCF